jgi:hypothetical protein
MDDIGRTRSAESSTADATKWIGRVLIAVLLGEGIWGLIVSITSNLVLPFLARTMGADAQSPLYLGKGDFNLPAVFISVLELCFAGMVAVILSAGVRRKPMPTHGKSARISPIPSPAPAPPPEVVPARPAASMPPPTPLPAPPSSPSDQFWSPPGPPAQSKASVPPLPPPTTKPARPKPAKAVYYNLVGEPINPTEDT